MSVRMTRPLDKAALHWIFAVSAQLSRSDMSFSHQPITDTLERPEASTILSASPRRSLTV